LNTDLIKNIKSNILHIFSRSILENRLRNIDYLPRWIIFGIDVGILIFANIITYFLVSNLTLSFYDTLDIPIRYGIVVGVNMIFFLFFRTYSGIIRHSTFLDGVKLLFSTTCSFVVLVVINYATFFAIGKKIYLIPGLFVNYIISFLLLFLFRIFVKYIFELYIVEKSRENLIRVLIYGADANAIAVANALKVEKPKRFRIVGFVDKENQNSSKRMLNLPILNLKRRMPVVMRSVNAEALIIADKSLSKEDRMVMIDECLEFNYKVYTVPAISDWEDSNEISKKVMNFQILDLLERNPIVLDNKSISTQLKDKTILITGAAGSIGSEIARQVIKFNPKKVIILDQAETPLHHLRLEMDKLHTETKIRTIISDVRNRDALGEVFKKFKPEVVFHAAAYKHVPLMEENPAQAVFVNVLGTKNVTDLSCEFAVENFVMVSTDKAVNPSNVMGASKRIAEKYVQSLHNKLNIENGHCKTKFITTRFGNVLGSNGSVVPLFTEQIAHGGPITITHPDIIRYFMTIPEACQLVLEAGAMGNGGEIFIFDMGKPVKIIDLANKMIRLAGLIPGKDIKIQIVGLRPGEKLYEELLNDTSKTLPTHHEKIMIAEEVREDFENLSKEVDGLISIAKSYENQKIVIKMKEIVPEFISMNSSFETLDS
jgi:FlaA1/EpsC-like NDP-sugar epimerase